MPLEQVVDLFGGDRQVFGVEVLEEVVVVFQSGEAAALTIDAAEGVSDIYLAQLVFTVHLQLVFKLQEVLKELAELHVGGVADALVCLLIGSDDFVCIFSSFELSLDV